MSLRLTIGIDPGLTGALATLADGKLISLHDMPTRERRGYKGSEVDAAALARILRGQRAAHPGAAVMLVLEKVGGGAGFGRQATSFIFNFGQGDGIIRGVAGALDIEMVECTPQKWKRYFGLIGSEKDAAREKAIELFPQFREALKRKKDIGRADAALIAAWAFCNEVAPWALPEPEIFANG